jgi:hypothetical protein
LNEQEKKKRVVHFDVSPAKSEEVKGPQNIAKVLIRWLLTSVSPLHHDPPPLSRFRKCSSY